MLPVDTIIADSFANEATFKTVNIDAISADWLGMDIGPKTRDLFTEEILKAHTIVWNGPMGVFEMENFAAGTYAIAEALAQATDKGATTIVGGGDSVAAINKMHFTKRISHVSTGGGASLEYLEGKTLPGIAVLDR